MEKYLQKLIVLLASLSLIGWAGCIKSNSTLPTDIPFLTVTVEPSITPVKTKTKEPTITDSIPSFKIFTEEMINELNNISQIVVSDKPPENFYRINTNQGVWELPRHDGKIIKIEVIDHLNNLILTMIDTTDLAGKTSQYSVLSSVGAVLLFDVEGYNNEKSWEPLFLFAPTIDAFVICPFYSIGDWYCTESKTEYFDFRGPLYVNIRINEDGVITREFSEHQFIELAKEQGLDPTEDIYVDEIDWNNLGENWCSLSQDNEEIIYKLPGSETVYQFGNGKCPIVTIEPMQ